MVGQRTMGRSLSTGRGATAAALVRRALRRRNLRPGWRGQVSLSLQDVDATVVVGLRLAGGIGST